jgi:hypothetical protein
MFRHVANRWHRSGLDSTYDDYLQAMTLAITEQWRDRPCDPEERTAWAWKVLRSAASRVRTADLRNRRQRQSVPDEIGLEAVALCEDEAGAECVRRESIRQMRAAVATLPASLRRVLQRFYGMDGRAEAGTVYQTAADLGQSVTETRAALNEARTLLEEQLHAHAV